MSSTQIGSVLGCLISYCDHISTKATAFLTAPKEGRRPSFWRSLPIYHMAMIFVIITSLVCVFVLDHLSKMLSKYLAAGSTKSNAVDSAKPADCDKKYIAIPQREMGGTLSFMDLPPEIRLLIYDHALPLSHPYIVGRDYGHTTSQLRLPSLCQVDRQIRAETLPLFFGGNTFIVDIHVLKDLKVFLRWVRILRGAERVGRADGREKGEGVLGWVRDLRITVGGCLLVDVVLKTGRRRYGDERVVAAKPMLDNSLKWDRKNILHYVQDPAPVKPWVVKLLAEVKGGGKEDSGLRTRHLVEMVEIIFKVEKLDAATKKVLLTLADM